MRQTLDNSGTPLARASYDPWGKQTGFAINPFGFTGELQDETGLTYLRARWYNSGTGVFTSRDPFSGFPTMPYSFNPYQYAYSNPVLLTDPTGESPDRPGVEKGRYFYTCNCGWLDTSHLRPNNGGRVINAVQKAFAGFSLVSNEGCDDYQIIDSTSITQAVGVPGLGSVQTTRNDVIIPKGAIKNHNDLLRVSMGIFRWVSLNQETSPLSWSSQFFDPLISGTSENTNATEDDLTSNLISFYAYVNGFRTVGQHFMNWLAPICGFPLNEKDRIEGSLKVYDSYGPFLQEQLSWENPRLIRNDCIDRYCAPIGGPRQWPSRFSAIQPEKGGVAQFLTDMVYYGDYKWYVLNGAPALAGK